MYTLQSVSAALAFLQSAGSGNHIVRSLPHDPASIFALLLVLVAAGAVLWFGRPKGGGGQTPGHTH